MSRTPQRELGLIMDRCEELHPGDVQAQMTWLLAVLRHCITQGLLDAPTLATLRKDSANWPELRDVLSAEKVAL
jgi:hypothetical protein